LEDDQRIDHFGVEQAGVGHHFPLYLGDRRKRADQRHRGQLVLSQGFVETVEMDRSASRMRGYRPETGATWEHFHGEDTQSKMSESRCRNPKRSSKYPSF